MRTKLLLQFEADIIKKKSTNLMYASEHWGNRYTLKRKWFEYLSFNILHIHKIKPITKYPVFIEFYFYFKSRCLDWLNCSLMAKIIEDTLVECEILKDDSNKYIKGGSIFVGKGEKDYFVVKIYSIKK